MIEVSVVPTDEYLANMLAHMEVVGKKAFPATSRALKRAAYQVIAKTWKAYAGGAPIKGTAYRMKRSSGRYSRSIKVRMLSPFNFFIVTEYPVAKFIEDGTSAYDMKDTHPFGKKSRVNAKGEPYLIIPFRHGAHGEGEAGSVHYQPMPEQVYARIRQAMRAGEFAKSKVLKGRRKEENYAGELIPRRTYEWGSRVQTLDPGLDRYEGMVAMDTGTRKSVRSGYFTFRVISVNSPRNKWIYPGTPPRHITQFVAQNTQELVKDMIEDGLKTDLGLL